MNLDFAKVCGKHSAIFEAYYKQIDPKGSGAIEAMTAAKFLKKSGLSDVVLSRIWDLSDPNGKGFLDKPGFFVALKLVSLAQAGQVINMSNIYMETANPPKVGDIPKIIPQRIQTVPPVSGGVPTGDWSIGVIERLKYEQLFESLKPINNMLPGNKVKGVLMDSKLPTDTLGKIWDLADQDKDGNLDKHEFIVAMHLVAQTLEKRTVPDILPIELRKPGSAVGPMPPKPAPPIVPGGVGMPRAPSGEGFADAGGFVANFPKDIAPPPVVPPPMIARLPPVGGTGTTPPLIGNTDAPLIPIHGPPSVADWVVTLADQKRYEIMFRQSDLDKDGLVSGLEVKNIFLQSGVPQNCLAHIWALCDTNQSGKLTVEQFALAMWLVERKQKGIEPPQVLMANMVPPSMRSIVPGVDMQSQPEPRPTYSNPELEMISKEIEELAKERRALELEIAQKESDIHIKKGEVRSLQGELDTLLATLKQLENQRGEAQKRLDDLKAQVNKIRDQCQKQEETINEQEGELNAKRSELQKLKDEETSLQKEYDENNRELQKLTNHLQNTQLQISSVRSMVTQLLEIQRQMTDALLMCRAAIESQDGELVSEYQLKIEPDFEEAKKTLEKKIEMEQTKVDPFDEEEKKDAMKSTTNGFSANGFENDPFAGGIGTATATASTIRSGFDDSFNAPSGFDSGNFDAFGSSSGFGVQLKDPFGGDAFGASKSNAITPEPGKDDFGSDPFAALHAPTGQGQVLSPNTQKSGPPPRPESPSPALPPKKSKVPPPRPAPPRPVQGPPRPAQPDAFGSSASGSGGFADFADFDNKQIANVFMPTTTATSFPTTTNTTFNDFFKNTKTTTTNNTNINNQIFHMTTAATTSSLSTRTSSISNLNTDLSSNSSSNLSLLASLAQGTGTRDGGGGSSGFGGASINLADFETSIFETKQTISTTPTLNETTNNHLTRSITPSMQQTATAAVFEVFDNTKATIAKLSATTTTTTTTAAATAASSFLTKTTTNNSVSGPTDFSDDPFKDYRYEDPFSIKDPFDDDEDVATAVKNDPSKFFKDDFENDKPVEIKNINKDEKPQFETPITIAPALSNEFVNQFDAFGLNPSPVPSHKSTASATKKSQEKIFENFADFDAFSTKSTSPSFITLDKNENKNTLTTTTIRTAATTSKNDSFFDAFNDNFSQNSDSNIKSSIFDAFGNIDDDNKNKVNVTTAFPMTQNMTTNSHIFDNSTITKKPSNNFEDDFDAFGNVKNIKTNSAKNFDNFEKFDAFGDCVDFPTDFSTNSTLNNSATMGSTKSALSSLSTTSSFSSLQKPLKKVQNETIINKKSNWNAKAIPTTNSGASNAGIKLPEKFASDYSKPETFDEDIQKAIERSMIDQ